MTPPRQVSISESDRAELERRVAAATTPRRDWQRATIILMAAAGESNPAISAVVGLNPDQVGVWRNRFIEQGMGALADRPRSGRPPTYGPTERLLLTKMITTRPPEGHPGACKSRLSMPEVARRLNDAEIPISYSQVWRICEDMDLKPWQVESWMTSHDPDFDAKAADVCGLYLNPPEGAMVFSIDEKSGMQATSRINPTRPAVPGTPVRQEFEYRRNGTAVLFGALNVGTGEIEGWVTNSTRSDNFVHFLRQLVAVTPDHLELHCVVDNLSAHGTAKVEAFLDDNPRVYLHRTPTHASWLNQIELWFSILTRQLLHAGEFDSPQHLGAVICDFIDDYTTRAQPFTWTYDAAETAA